MQETRKPQEMSLKMHRKSSSTHSSAPGLWPSQTHFNKATSYFLSQTRTLVRDAGNCCSAVSKETCSPSATPVLTDISASWTILTERRTSPQCGLVAAFQHLQVFQHYLCSLGFDFHSTPLIEILSLSIRGKGLSLQDSARQLQLRAGSPEPNQTLPAPPCLHPAPKHWGAFQKAKPQVSYRMAPPKETRMQVLILAQPLAGSDAVAAEAELHTGCKSQWRQRQNSRTVQPCCTSTASSTLASQLKPNAHLHVQAGDRSVTTCRQVTQS